MITLANSIRLPPPLTLEMLQTEYAGGNQQALALAVHLCGQRSLPLPPWVVEAWSRGCYDIVDRRVESWDEILANGKRKTIKQRRRERAKAQKLWLIRHRAFHYRDIPISNNRQRLKRVGNRLTKAPDRFDEIALDLTADGKVRGAFGPVSRSEAKALWYEIFPAERSTKPAKQKTPLK